MEALAMVLVGGRGSRLKALTKATAKPAVPFLGKYKLIDFVLSNLTHSGIDTVGIITQYEPRELMHYIGRGSSWDLDTSEGGVQFLTPYSSLGGVQFQKGTADAIRQHTGFIDRYDPDYVIILSGDHVYTMNYGVLIDHAKALDADMVIGAFTPDGDRSRFGIIEMRDGLLTGFEEKPQSPKSTLASMGVYVFKTDVLNALLETDGLDDFGSNVIPLALRDHYTIGVYPFDGYFKDVGTIDALYKANMEILDHPEKLGIYDKTDHPVYSGSENLPPHHIVSADYVKNSVISDGTLCLGRLNHCIVAHGCFIKEDATIEDSIVHPNVTIGEYATVKNAILLEGTVVLPKTQLVFDTPTIIDNEILWQMGEQS